MASKVEIIGDDSSSQTTQANQLQLNEWHYFTSAVYTVQKPEFLKDVNKISREYVNRIKKNSKLDEIYPVYMSENMYTDPRLGEFTNFIAYISKDILTRQGYNLTNLDVAFFEMWTQEHYKFSGQEEHVHPGSQISGFYFLDVPKNSTRVIIHDPRPAKIFSNLPEQDMSLATYGSTMINFMPEAGTMMFTNSWLPHSFTKNPADKPFRFIHFNLGVVAKQQINTQVSAGPGAQASII
jgi:uncharacterized protein (TIGR02466 family)